MSTLLHPTGLPVNTKVFAYVSDAGDPSVGIFATSWEVECPFWKEDAEPEDYELFRTKLAELYSDYCEGRIHVYFNTDPDFIG